MFSTPASSGSPKPIRYNKQANVINDHINNLYGDLEKMDNADIEYRTLLCAVRDKVQVCGGKKHNMSNIQEICNDVIEMSTIYFNTKNAGSVIDEIRENKLLVETLKQEVEKMNSNIVKHEQELGHICNAVKEINFNMNEGFGQLQHNITYAEKVKMAGGPAAVIGTREDPREPDHIIFVRVKKESTFEETKKTLLKQVNPLSLNVRVNRMTKLKKPGNLLLSLPTKKEQEVLFKALTANEKLDREFVITKPIRLKPRIIVTNVIDEFDENEDFLQTLIAQNPDIFEDSAMRVVTKFEKKYNSDWIIEMDPKTFNACMKKGKLFVGWSSCRVFESLYVRGCAKCGMYGHIKKNCPNDIEVCTRCGGPHHERENGEVVCHKNLHCNNCAIANQQFSTNFDVAHSLRDRNCPCYLQEQNMLRKKIDYEF